MAFGLAVEMPVLIGLMMLMGVAAKNSILLIDYAIERERAGAPQREALLDACAERARPIVMTTCAMAAGMSWTATPLDAGLCNRTRWIRTRPLHVAPALSCP